MSFWICLPEFIFVYDVRKCSNIIRLHVAIQFSQHHLLKRLSLPHCILASIAKNKVPIGAWISGLSILFHWFIFLVLCQYHIVLMTVALWYNRKSGRLIFLAPFFFLNTALAIGVFCVSIWIVKFFVLVLWKIPLVIWQGLQWICRLLWVVSSFSQWIHPIQEYGISLHLFVSLIYFITVL